MSVGGVTSSNGMFTITDAGGKSQQVDLGTLMMMLKINQTNNLDEQLADMLGEIQERNNLISALTDFLSQCRTLKADMKDDGAVGTDGKAKEGSVELTLAGTDGKARPIQGSDGWATYFGISSWSNTLYVNITDDPETFKAVWDSNINNIKSKIDTLNNDSQMANIKLQNLLEKRNNAFDMATQAMSSNNDSVASTIRNL